MKTKAQKQKDLEALTEQFPESPGSNGRGLSEDDRCEGSGTAQTSCAKLESYEVVKNTLARKAAEGTPFEVAQEHFKGVTAVALSAGDPVGLSKAISKFTKANPDIFTFKAGVVEGKVVALRDVEAIASLPSKEELISKVMFLINCQAQRLVTVISAVPRNLAIVIKQIGEQKSA